MNPKIFVAFAAGVAVSGAVFLFVTNRPATELAPGPVARAVSASETRRPEVPKEAESVTVEANTAGAREVVAKPFATMKAPADQGPAVKERWGSTAPAAAVLAAPRPVDAKPAQAAVEAAVAQAAVAPVRVPTPEPAPAAVRAEIAEPETVRAEPPREAPRRELVALTPAPTASLPPAPAESRKVTLAGGTVLTIRLGEKLSSERQKSGDAFRATLDQPLIVDGLVIAERGASVEGRVTESGKTNGTSRLGLELIRFTSSDGQVVGVKTAEVDRQGTGGGTAKSNAKKVAIGAAAGAILGGIFGGGKGAGIGAAAGGATGGGVVLATRGKPAEIAAETRLTFQLSEPVAITEKLNP